MNGSVQLKSNALVIKNNTKVVEAIALQKSTEASIVMTLLNISDTILKNGDITCLGGSFSSNGDVTNNNGLSDVWLFLLDANGILKWQKSYGGSKGETGNDFVFTSDSKIIIVGTTSSDNGIFNNNFGNGDIAVIQVKYDFRLSTENINDLLDVKIFPNPLNNVLNIQVDDEIIEDINLSDLSGRVIKHNKIETHSHSVEINCTDLSIGTYILELKTANFVGYRKIIIMR